MNGLQKNNISDKNMRCDIILPICDQYEFTKKCVESIIENTDTPFRLIIINNGKNPSTHKLLDSLKKRTDVHTTIVTNEQNVGWVKAINKGMELSDAPYLCFQNDDTIVTHGWLKKMINILNKNEKFGLINPSWQGRPASVSIDQYNSILEKNSGSFIETDLCRGFSIVFKRSVAEKIGKVDEIYSPAYFDDSDYSMTAMDAGFLCLKALDTYVYHHMNVTFFEVLKGKKWNELFEKNKLIYYKKWGKPLNIGIVLNEKAFKNTVLLKKIEDAVFYLARKQHHITIWSSKRLDDRLRHTNIKVKVYPAFLIKTLVLFAVQINKKKRPEKRYDLIFEDAGDPNFSENIIKKTNNAKEKTKEKINVSL